MTKSISSLIGRHSSENGKFTNAPETRTIFVAIASYRDWQCRFTVESIFQRAKFPERIRVGVVDQIEIGKDPSCDIPIKPCEEYPNQALCQYRHRIDVYELESSLATGPTFARHITHRLYRGEYYIMQLDSHVTMVTNWDTDIISQFDATQNDMAVISTVPPNVVDSIDTKTGLSIRGTRHIMCHSEFDGKGKYKFLRHLVQPELHPVVKDSPQLQPYWSAGFSFARGHFVINVPYDPHLPMIFHGEEISMGLRAFTHGYDFYAPERNVCFHTDNQNVEDEQSSPKHFLENETLYQGIEKHSMARLLGLIHMNPIVDPSTWNHAQEETYGIGKVRDVSKFFTCFGIHVQVKRTEHQLCDFVQSGKMHDMFVDSLRSNGMGIDYDNINFRFHELQSIKS